MPYWTLLHGTDSDKAPKEPEKHADGSVVSKGKIWPKGTTVIPTRATSRRCLARQFLLELETETEVPGSRIRARQHQMMTFLAPPPSRQYRAGWVEDSAAPPYLRAHYDLVEIQDRAPASTAACTARAIRAPNAERDPP